MALVTPPLPPLQANSGRCSPPSRSMSWVRPDRIGPTGLASLAVEHSGEAGAALDDLLEHDVGGVESALRAGLGVVVDLDDQRRAVGWQLPGASGRPVSGIRGIARLGGRRRRQRRRRLGRRGRRLGRGRGLARGRRRLGRLGTVGAVSSAASLSPLQAWPARRGCRRAAGGERSGSAGGWDVGMQRGGHSSLSRLIRSSSGGCVSNSLWIDPSRPWSPTPLMGCSIHKCAVAVDAACVTVVSSRNFSRAEIKPGGYLVSWHALTSARVSRRR